MLGICLYIRHCATYSSYFNPIFFSLLIYTFRDDFPVGMIGTRLREVHICIHSFSVCIQLDLDLCRSTEFQSQGFNRISVPHVFPTPSFACFFLPVP